MTLGQFWTRHHVTMPLSKSRKNNKPRQLTTNSATSLFQHDCEQEGDDSEMKLKPGLAKALEIMTSKLSTILEPWLKTVLSHTNELKRVRDRLDEVKARMLYLQTANNLQAAKMLALSIYQ